MRNPKGMTILLAMLLTTAMLAGCANKAADSPEVVLTGEDIGIFVLNNDDGTKTIVDAGGNDLGEYKLDANGNVLKDGKAILAADAISEFIPAKSCTIDVATEVLLEPNADRTAPAAQRSAEVKIKIEPANASNTKFFVSTVDEKIIKLGNGEQTLTVKTDEKGEAVFTATFTSTGTGILTVTNAANGAVIGKAFCTVSYSDNAVEAKEQKSDEQSNNKTEETLNEKTGIPVVTKNPTDVTVIPGSNAAFTSRATNADKYAWYAISPDGQTTISASKLTEYFKTMIVGGVYTDTLTLENIPSEMHNWKVKCAFSNAHGTTSSLEAKVMTVAVEKPRDTEVHVDTGNVVAAHTHSYTLEVVAPTATEQGYTLHYCMCGDKFCTDWTDPVPVEVHVHSYSVDTSTPGKTTYTCTGCGYSYSE